MPGLALGHAASYAAATALGLALLRPRLGSLDARRIGRTLARTVPAAAVTALTAWLVATGIGSVGDMQTVAWRIVQVGPPSVPASGTYLVAALMLGIAEVDEVMGAVRRRFRGE